MLSLEWRANLIRWQISRYWGKPNTDLDLAEYDRWIESELADLALWTGHYSGILGVP